MKQLIHNGVLIPQYDYKHLHLLVKGVKVELTPKQEEMALSWVKKLGTKYVKDKIFARNFFKDFCEELKIDKKISLNDIDFTPIIEYIEHERALKLSLSQEEKRKLSEERRLRSEAERERYGYAIVDGLRIEISNYRVEPSCIFLGRGKHPLRGRWKEGPKEENIELNLSPDAPKPPGNWKGIVWQPESLWIARWRDKLLGKMKYVWISENSIIKQKRDIEKFEKARELRRNLPLVKRHIWNNLVSEDLRRRKIATVCFLIDLLKIRVGDEKDPDEADTVGASTLRPEHITFNGANEAIFNFLGKDSVPHIFRVKLPGIVIENLKEFCSNAESTIFSGVDSRCVTEFLSEVMKGLSAKVFRTCYASATVEEKLKSCPVKVETPHYIKKYYATIANLEAAKVCNHKRTIPKSWRTSLQKRIFHFKKKIKEVKGRQRKLLEKIRQKEERFSKILEKRKEEYEKAIKRIEIYKQKLALKDKKGKSRSSLRMRIRLERKSAEQKKNRIREVKKRYEVQLQRLRERLRILREHSMEALERMRLQIEVKKKTRDYNLATSLRSYIDPRIYYEWGKKVNYDWKLYYPKTLQKKFSWVETNIDGFQHTHQTVETPQKSS